MATIVKAGFARLNTAVTNETLEKLKVLAVGSACTMGEVIDDLVAVEFAKRTDLQPFYEMRQAARQKRGGSSE